jgi:peptidoglycan hydrolase-like protein with peptidoglycan-binding domain
MSDPIIKIGSTGDAVRKAQQALYCRRYLVDLSEVDGVFGPITRNRVIRYQLDRSVGEFAAFSFPLAVDGIVGPMTWSRLTPPLIKKGSKPGVSGPGNSQELGLPGLRPRTRRR